jgi:type IV pilus assembly protein PilA
MGYVHRIRARLREEQGFTLIELLVVIVIIGILATIALPAFLDQRHKAADVHAKSYVNTASLAMESYALAAGDFNPDAATIADITEELQDAAGWTITPGTTDYTVAVESTSGRTFRIERQASGRALHTCSPAGGGCRDDNTW